MPHNPLTKSHKPKRKMTKQHAQKIFSQQIQHQKEEDNYLKCSQAQIQKHHLKEKKQRNHPQAKCPQKEQAENKQIQYNQNNIIFKRQQWQKNFHYPRRRGTSPQVRIISSSSSKLNKKQIYAGKPPDKVKQIKMPWPPNRIQVQNPILAPQSQSSDLDFLKIYNEAEQMRTGIKKMIQDECKKERRIFQEFMGQLHKNELHFMPEMQRSDNNIIFGMQSEKTGHNQISEIELQMNSQLQFIYRKPRN